MTVRLATLGDIDAIVAMALAFIDATVYAAVLTKHPERIAQFAADLINGVQPGVLLVAADGDAAPVGMIGGLRFENPFSGDAFAQECFWWVSPEARGSVGGRLKVAFSQWARGLGVAGVFWSSPTAEVDALYAKRGHLRVETNYLERF